MENEYIVPNGDQHFGHILASSGGTYDETSRTAWETYYALCRQPWGSHEAELTAEVPVQVCDRCSMVAWREAQAEREHYMEED